MLRKMSREEDAQEMHLDENVTGGLYTENDNDDRGDEVDPGTKMRGHTLCASLRMVKCT